MYTIKYLADLAGISTRTLRYYDEIGLLKPVHLNPSGFRLYNQTSVEMLQQILFYKALGMPLGEIKKIVTDSNFNKKEALYSHREKLVAELNRLQVLLKNINQTIKEEAGEEMIDNKDRFEGLKKGLLEKNEKNHGTEMRALYGQAADAANEKFLAQSEETFNQVSQLTQEMHGLFKEACLAGDIKSTAATQACEMHVEWIKNYWTTYSKEAHLALVQMYVEDARFKEYYDDICEGLAVFIKDAMGVYLK